MPAMVMRPAVLALLAREPGPDYYVRQLRDWTGCLEIAGWIRVLLRRQSRPSWVPRILL